MSPYLGVLALFAASLAQAVGTDELRGSPTHPVAEAGPQVFGPRLPAMGEMIAEQHNYSKEPNTWKTLVDQHQARERSQMLAWTTQQDALIQWQIRQIILKHALDRFWQHHPDLLVIRFAMVRKAYERDLPSQRKSWWNAHLPRYDYDAATMEHIVVPADKHPHSTPWQERAKRELFFGVWVHCRALHTAELSITGLPAHERDLFLADLKRQRQQRRQTPLPPTTNAALHEAYSKVADCLAHAEIHARAHSALSYFEYHRSLADAVHADFLKDIKERLPRLEAHREEELARLHRVRDEFRIKSKPFRATARSTEAAIGPGMELVTFELRDCSYNCLISEFLIAVAGRCWPSLARQERDCFRTTNCMLLSATSPLLGSPSTETRMCRAWPFA